MSPTFIPVFEKMLGYAESHRKTNPSLCRHLKFALGDDLADASDSIQQIEKQFDPLLAAVAWSFFWIRQGELYLARDELQRAIATPSQSLWLGVCLIMLGKICVEIGEAKRGAAYLRDARKILDEPL